MTMTPKTNYSWFGGHQDTRKTTRRIPNNLKRIFWKSDNLNSWKYWKCASHHFRKFAISTFETLKFWNIETLKLWSFETFDFQVMESHHPSAYRLPHLHHTTLLGDTRGTWGARGNLGGTIEELSDQQSFVTQLFSANLRGSKVMSSGPTIVKRLKAYFCIKVCVVNYSMDS